MRLKWMYPMVLSAVLSGCAATQTGVRVPDQAQEQSKCVFQYKTVLDSSNPFAQKSNLPYGIMDFTKIKAEHYMPAIEAGMAQQLEEIEYITSQTDEPTFENTMIPLEKSGTLLNRVYPYFSNDAGANTNDAIKNIQKNIAPKLASHNDAIYLNDKLFQRIAKLYEMRDALSLDAEASRLIEEYYKKFVRSGALLDDAGKKRMREINETLAALMTAFGQNILAEMNDASVVVEDVRQLDGMTNEQIQAAAALAQSRGLDGKYVIALVNTSIQPALKSIKDRDLRKKIHEASVTRGMRDNASNNLDNALQILRLRAERSALLGYDHYAAYSLDDKVAHTVEAAENMLKSMIEPAKLSLDREKSELQALADAQHADIQIEAYDWLFYEEQVRKQKYHIDDSVIKPYFELNQVIQNGVFYAAEKLYGITFVERKDIPVYNPDVRIFEVLDADGSPLALFIGDYYARPNKRGGAWKSALSTQTGLTGDKHVIINQLNIPKPPAGEPTLLTFDEVTTLFHEFGHALHGMFTHIRYPSLTSVPRDFVEFPSQVNEIWATWPEILTHYAKHYQTGEVLPSEWIDKIIAANQFGQGYATTENLAASMLDLAWHKMGSDALNGLFANHLEATESSLLDSAGLLLSTTPPRYRTAYYNHIFVSGYAAGYYSYLWSEVLDADAEAWFKANGLSREHGDHLRKTVLSRGNTQDAMQMYRAFIGRDPDVTPLLERRGLMHTPE